jgi:outer membrane receptor for ferrienterochelin and colicins
VAVVLAVTVMLGARPARAGDGGAADAGTVEVGEGDAGAGDAVGEALPEAPKARLEVGVGARAPAPAPEAVIDVVVTGTRTPERWQRATVKTDVVTRKEAERRGATNVAEALATQPGVQVNPGAYGYLGGVSPIQIQGFDLGRVLILADGEPVIGDVGGAIDLSTIPIADIERIEIVTGPTSSLYGSSALGGVVNIISAPPRARGGSGRARLEARNHRGAVLEAVAAQRGARAFGALDFAFSRRDGIAERDGAPDLRVPATARAAAGLRAGAALGEHVDVQVRGRWLYQQQDGVESQTYPGLGTYITDAQGRATRFALQALGTARWGGSTLRLSLARQWVDRTGATAPRESPLGETQRTAQAMTSAEATATVADGARTWVAGARVELQDARQEVVTMRDEGGAVVTTVAQELAPRDLSAAAAYGQLQWRLGPLTVLPGMRGEHHGSFGGVVAPRLAASVRLGDAVMLRAAAGRGFRAPSAKELGFDFDHSMYGYRVLGNPDLGPERSWGANGDVAWTPAPTFTARAGGFANWVQDLIDIDLAGGVTSGTVVTYAYRNVARVRTAGAQAGATARPWPWLRADLTYDYLWTRDVVAGTPLPGRPANTLTASLQAELPARLDVTVRARFVGDAYVDADTRSPGYETIDLRVARPVTETVSAYAGVLNALDVHQDPGRVGDLRPPLGRVIYAGVRGALPGEGP